VVILVNEFKQEDVSMDVLKVRMQLQELSLEFFEREGAQNYKLLERGLSIRL